eukprot:2147290-Alexandrium_andersonii.AAC.1
MATVTSPVTSPAGEGLLRIVRWCPEAARAAKLGAWPSPCDKVETRAAVVAAAQGGAARRTAPWNAFVVACVPYAAQIASPHAAAA